MLQRVISFEGIDGSGKSTYHKRLVEILKSKDYDVYVPRYEEWEKDTKVNVKELSDDVAFFYHLAGTLREEWHLVQKEWQHHDFTVLDRGLDTNIVYSHLFKELDRPRSFYDAVNETFYRYSRVPDLTFWVSTPVDIALQRIHKTRESAEFYETENYLTQLNDLFSHAAAGTLSPYNEVALSTIGQLSESRWQIISGTISYEEADIQMEKSLHDMLSMWK